MSRRKSIRLTPLREFRRGFNAGKQNLMNGTWGFGWSTAKNELRNEYIRGYRAGQREVKS